MDNYRTDYTVFYRWQWFRREQLRNTFRENKMHSSNAFSELVYEKGLEKEHVLDSTCGLGFKTIIIKENGLRVEGCDENQFAIKHAKLLSEEEGINDINYFQSKWKDLSQNSNKKYAAIFNDAISWIYTEQEMAESLKGIYEALIPSGVFVYMGALPYSVTDNKKILEEEWKAMTSNGKFQEGSFYASEEKSVLELFSFEKGVDYIDNHHIYFISDKNQRPQFETMTMRHVVKWNWNSIEPYLIKAGFKEFSTKEFITNTGKPWYLVVAEKP